MSPARFCWPGRTWDRGAGKRQQKGDTVATGNTERLIPWFVLRSVPGVGNHLFKRLLDRFSTPESVLAADRDQLLQVPGITRRVADAVLAQKLLDPVRRELDRLAQKPDCHVILMTDPAYPGLLRQIPDPPPFLYVLGHLNLCSRSIAIVGSRSPTRYGLQTARRLSAELAELGFTVASGMARGIDTAAHDGALRAGGRTVAVLGSGLDRIYPHENRDLSRRIAGNGAVVTEFPLNAGPEPHHFPMRNRIISGLSLGTVVVEAARRSGALITARLAAEQNREVFAVPGNIQSSKSSGTHRLIQQGAKLVENARDIVEELSPAIQTHIARQHVRHEEVLNLPPLTESETRVVQALGPYPVHIDDLVRKLEMDPATLSGLLLQLELKGVVGQSPGKRFSLEIRDGN